jgi:hypothetical protein
VIVNVLPVEDVTVRSHPVLFVPEGAAALTYGFGGVPAVVLTEASTPARLAGLTVA